MFSFALAAVLSVLSILSVASAKPMHIRDNGLTLFNGQNTSWAYEDSIVGDNTLFGMGCLRTGAPTPAKVISDG